MTVKLVSLDRWRNVKDELPELEQKVWACWGKLPENIVEMDYVEDIVKGKVTRLFTWYGRISPWEVLYWQPYFQPEPPKEGK